MDYFVHIGERRIRVELGGDGLCVDGSPLQVELGPRSVSPARIVRVGARSLRVIPRRNGRGDWTLDVNGVRYHMLVLDARQEAVHAAKRPADVATGPAPLRAPMPGLVIRVEVEPGDIVEPGDGVVIVEAMKMENELKAESLARVAAVRAEVGEAVEKDQTLVEFEALEEAL